MEGVSDQWRVCRFNAVSVLEAGSLIRAQLEGAVVVLYLMMCVESTILGQANKIDRQPTKTDCRQDERRTNRTNRTNRYHIFVGLGLPLNVRNQLFLWQEAYENRHRNDGGM